MKKLTREMLIIKRKNGGQKCKTCPFAIGAVYATSCCENEINGKLFETINHEFDGGCLTHSITLKPEYNGID